MWEYIHLFLKIDHIEKFCNSLKNKKFSTINSVKENAISEGFSVYESDNELIVHDSSTFGLTV